MIRIDFDNSYARLPERFFARCSPTPVPDPQLVCLNEPLARELGLDPAALASPEGVAMLAGNLLPRGAEPIAMAYAGHQFGNFVPQLGDGRAVLLGEIRDCCGLRRDLQLKGAGRTPFSRMGDGRAVLGPAIREYVVSEAMARLGVPTTRSLAVVTTGERILREAPKPGAVLARVAGSHVRVGTFHFFASRGDLEALRALADYVIERHYPQAAGGNRYGMLLEQVVARTAALIASWQLIGFIHGVMNTDNMSVAGETIDYGPCAFMDAYHPDTVYSSIDAHGRYAYGQQPYIAQWNLARLAQALLPLLAPQQPAALEIAQAAIDAFPSRFEAAYRAGLGAKLGLADPQPGDEVLAADLLARMADGGADFTLTFRRLAEALPGGAGPRAVRALFADPAVYDGWALQWHARLAGEPMTHLQRGAAMRAVNPVYIPRNHRLEAVISAAELRGDFQPLVTLLEVLASPFTERAGFAAFADPPRPEEIVHQTFCGT